MIEAVAALGVSHVEAWHLPLGYVVRMLDAAAPDGGGGRRDEEDEPIVTPDGVELPPGMAAFARLQRRVVPQG